MGGVAEAGEEEEVGAGVACMLLAGTMIGRRGMRRRDKRRSLLKMNGLIRLPATIMEIKRMRGPRLNRRHLHLLMTKRMNRRVIIEGMDNEVVIEAEEVTEGEVVEAYTTINQETTTTKAMINHPLTYGQHRLSQHPLHKILGMHKKLLSKMSKQLDGAMTQLISGIPE